MADSARVRITKQLIMNSFIELVKEKPFDKITLKEVCEMAEINHSTFYRYYSDIYDWKEKLEDRCRARVHELANRSNSKNIRQLLLDQLNDFIHDREIYQLLASPNFNSTILEEAYAICIDNAESSIKEKILHDPTGKDKWKCTFLVCGSYSVIERWCRDGMVEPPEDVVDYLMENITNYANS